MKQDPYSLINTMLKMAKKRALVDAVLSATRSSDLFTQDLEDMKGMEPMKEVLAEEPITQPQLIKLKLLGKELGISRDEGLEILKKYEAARTQELTKTQAIELVGKLMAMKEAL